MPESPPAFVFSADWHLCRSAWSGSSATGDADHALRQVVDLAAGLGVPLVAGGDLFDSSSPHPDDLAVAGAEMARMERAGLPVYFVQGNHDRYVELRAGKSEPTPWLNAASRWPSHMDDCSFGGAWTAHALDFMPTSRLGPKLTELGRLGASEGPVTADDDDDENRRGLVFNEDIDFLVVHQAWAELVSKGDSHGRLVDVPGRAVVLTGDLHRCEAIEFAPGRMAYSPGAIHRLAIDEPDEHYVLVVHEDGTVLKHQLSSRVACRAVVETQAELDDFVANGLTFLAEDAADRGRELNLPAALRTPLLRVRYRADLPDALARLRAAAEGKFHLFPLAVEPEALAAPEGEELEDAVPAGLLGGLAAYDLGPIAARTGDDPEALRADLARLLDPSVPAAKAVAALVAERLAGPA